jgi:hypothetical protein
MNTQEKLDRLAELDAHRDAVLMDKEVLKQQIVPTEIKQMLRDVDSEYDPKLEAIAQERVQLEAEVRNDVMVTGESVKGNTYRASYVLGRTSWDTAALDGYAAAHPEISQFKKLGVPTVRIAKV